MRQRKYYSIQELAKSKFLVTILKFQVKAVGHHKPIDQISQMDMNIEEKPYACDCMIFFFH